MRDGRCVVLLGSGEFEPWSEETDRYALSRARSGDGTVLILPTASAPEGDETFDRWANKGLQHFERIGVPARVLPLKTREDARLPELVEALFGASVLYFSGGNPAYLVRTLEGTPFWSGLLEAIDRGVAYVGCSAGAACLGEIAPDSSKTELSSAIWTTGLRLFPKTVFGPHWNMLEHYLPGVKRFILDSVPEDCWLLAVDENTAMGGDFRQWRVFGEGQVMLYRDGVSSTYGAGEAFNFSPPPGDLDGTSRTRP